MEAFGRSSNPGPPRSSRSHEQKNSEAHPQFSASTRRRHACPASRQFGRGAVGRDVSLMTKVDRSFQPSSPCEGSIRAPASTTSTMGTCFRRPHGRSRSSSWRTTLAHWDSTPTCDYWRPSCWPSRAATSWRSATGADVHERCDNANRRLCSQAFFTKIYIDEDDQLRVENNRPSKCSSIPRPTPTPSPVPKTETRPEPKPSKMARVRALCVGWSIGDSNP